MSDSSKKFRFKKPPLSASLFALVGTGILLSLGTWQAQKFVAKTADRNAALCTQDISPIYTGNFTALDQSPYAACPNKIALSGKPLDTVQIPVGPRMHDEQMGYHLYMPLQGEDGSIILFNTGWTGAPERAISPAITAQTIQVTGTLLRPSEPNHFTPDNSPASNEWFSIRMEEIRAKYPAFNNDNLADHVFIASAVYPPDTLADFVPAEMAKSFLTPEMHFQYAGFWYFMALALIGVFTMRFVIVRDKD